MKLGRLNHIGVATPSIEASLEHYRGVLGASITRAPFDMIEQGVRVCFIDIANTQIELIEPLGAESPIHNFLSRAPQGGQHHVCYEVADLDEAIAHLKAKGVRLLGEKRIGAHGMPIVFAHPKDMGGVLTELMQQPPAGAMH